jgi:carbon storage regulator
MLVLLRRVGEEIVIGGTIRLVVKQVDGRRVRLGVIAPASAPVHRSEVLDHRRQGERGGSAGLPATKQPG